ncbi:acyl CoA:acetate/3-ketoacid CoA transferase [Loigolactobacillus bifermentans]|uniref:Propionate CoA-transferase n=1 Tax=Loigolactobacillus bifermentans DSM 20003 TaxID=1423726 RepID=A0A0R1H0B6_9LACO|nr:CoA-transferase [Loigolactobacillus bifermentans]KRK40060.1 propionate CoA-transferase [Loigolactobacillus bifermentans DSM 20003]QGG61603.1 3-oxoacid CoA-transferase [Loigolactobacillus bifermentans]
MTEFISSDQAAQLIPDNAIIALEGFMGTDVAEEIYIKIYERFAKEGHPKALTLEHASGIGNGVDKGVSHFAHASLLKCIIGGHHGLAPQLEPLINSDAIQAYNFPQGVISQAFRSMAGDKPFLISKVGLGTFIDPDLQGGKLNQVTTEDLVGKLNVDGKDYLTYKLPRPNWAILRGTFSDENGNITFDDEPLVLESTAIAMAAHNNGGKVIVQVKRKVKNGSLKPKDIRIPGLLVDYVVETTEDQYMMQTNATVYNPDYVNANVIKAADAVDVPMNQRKIIGRRAALLLTETDHIVNYGIGMPETVSLVLKEEGVADQITTTVEPGTFGGVPMGGGDFGSALAPESTIDEPYMFDFYDGGGIDIAFLGLAQCNQHGDINVSKFGPKIPGVGGFVNISQNTQRVVYTGTFTAGGLKIKTGDGKLQIVQEGRNDKFVDQLEQITFSGKVAYESGQQIYYVTERAVFKLEATGLTLIEIAPGVELQKDILEHMQFKPTIVEDLKLMDQRIFTTAPMGLATDRLNHSVSLSVAQ